MLKEAFKFMWYDKAKMFGILFGIILSVFLIGQQLGICFALLGGTISLAENNKQYIWVVSDKSQRFTFVRYAYFTGVDDGFRCFKSQYHGRGSGECQIQRRYQNAPYAHWDPIAASHWRAVELRKRQFGGFTAGGSDYNG